MTPTVSPDAPASNEWTAVEGGQRTSRHAFYVPLSDRTVRNKWAGRGNLRIGSGVRHRSDGSSGEKENVIGLKENHPGGNGRGGDVLTGTRDRRMIRDPGALPGNQSGRQLSRYIATRPSRYAATPGLAAAPATARLLIGCSCSVGVLLPAPCLATGRLSPRNSDLSQHLSAKRAVARQ